MQTAKHLHAALALLISLLIGLSPAAAAPIDRAALVHRHDPRLARIDPHAPLMLGNGQLGFTADITGLQTFPEQYAATSPLLTMAQWAWHSFPNPRGYSEKDGLVPIDVPGRGKQPYSYMRDLSEVATRPALAWLRENPHRFSLGRLSLALTGRDGRPARFEQIGATAQHLDMWTGTLASRFTFEGQPVIVETRVHPTRDIVFVSIRSPLVAARRLGVDLRYPGVSPKLNPDPTDFGGAIETTVVGRTKDAWLVRNTLDSTIVYSSVGTEGGEIARTGAHSFRVLARARDRLVVTVGFGRTPPADAAPTLSAAIDATAQHWRDYWSRGGMVDFSGSRDPRAAELERRVVLSQYLTAINGAGEVPPQEEGLFSNSWNGKFHLEMHAWHSGHFAAWSRPALLENSMGWYLGYLPTALTEARRHGAEGAWWPKMSGPEGRNSPSPINPFIMWQQPHPIYLAELLYRADPGGGALKRYGEIVEQTARLLASWPRWDAASGRYIIGPPIVPVQENHDPMITMNPAFEVEYFRWGLETAQVWRVRRGLPREPAWDGVIAKMAPVAQRDGLYLPAETTPDFWQMTISPACRANAAQPKCLNRDHPSFLMAYGLIGSDRIDPAAMARTLAATTAAWDTRQLWGWDFPMIAMTAARLGQPGAAIDWLLRDSPNNHWGSSGMTPRNSLGANGARVADTYFPSNGALLLAVGMMSAGWTGSSGAAPGFPKDGWVVKAEGIAPLP